MGEHEKASNIEFLKHPSTYLKAILSAFIAFIGPIVVYLQSEVDNTLDLMPQGVWAGAVLLGLTSFAAVFGVSNRDL